MKQKKKWAICLLIAAVVMMMGLTAACGSGEAGPSLGPEVSDQVSPLHSDLGDSLPEESESPAPSASLPPASDASALPEHSAGAAVSPSVSGAVSSQKPSQTPGGSPKPSVNAEKEAVSPSASQSVQATDTPAPSPAVSHPESGETDVLTCTLTIRCDTLLDQLDRLDAGKAALVPEDGVIFSQKVTFTQGESVFDILQREMRQAKIPLEFSSTPLYNGAYIEGINNLYEMDAGPQSGWMYQVNGVYPGYSCSQHQLSDGDTVIWRYTLNRGRDIGGEGASGGGG